MLEATFAHDDILARVDIVERLPWNKYRPIEVKSPTKAVLPALLPDMTYAGMGIAILNTKSPARQLARR